MEGSPPLVKKFAVSLVVLCCTQNDSKLWMKYSPNRCMRDYLALTALFAASIGGQRVGD